MEALVRPNGRCSRKLGVSKTTPIRSSNIHPAGCLCKRSFDFKAFCITFALSVNVLLGSKPLADDSLVGSVKLPINFLTCCLATPLLYDTDQAGARHDVGDI